VANPVLETSQASNSTSWLANWVYRLVFSGLLLLPFSTSPGANSFVVSYGLPILAIAAIAAIFYLFSQNVHFHVSLKGVIWSSSIYVLFLVVFSFFSPEIIPSLGRSLPNVIGFLIFLFILSFSHEQEFSRLKILKKFVFALVLSGSILSIYYIANFAFAAFSNSFAEVILSRGGVGLTRLPWGASNTIAALLVMPMVAAMASLYMDDARTYFKYFAIFLMIVAIFATLSRTVIVLLIYLFFFQSILTRQFKLLTFFIGFTLLTVGFIFFSYHEVFDLIMLHRLEDLESTLTLMGRTDIWKEFLEYLRKNPFSPIGYYGAAYVFGYSCHNTFLTTMVEMGITGIIIMVTFYSNLIILTIRAIRQAETRNNNIIIVLFVGLTTILLNLMDEDPNYTQQYIIFFWIYIGVMSLVTIPTKLSSVHPETQLETL